MNILLFELYSMNVLVVTPNFNWNWPPEMLPGKKQKGDCLSFSGSVIFFFKNFCISQEKFCILEIMDSFYLILYLQSRQKKNFTPNFLSNICLKNSFFSPLKFVEKWSWKNISFDTVCLSEFGFFELHNWPIIQPTGGDKIVE